MSWCDTGAYLQERGWTCDCGNDVAGWRHECGACGLKDTERECEK